MTDHTTAEEIGETAEEQVEMLRANAEPFRDSSPCLWGLMNRAADTIDGLRWRDLELDPPPRTIGH